MQPTWLSDIDPKRRPKLDKDLSADFLVIGGGIAGTTAAYELSKTGKRVVLLEKSGFSDSVTAYTTAFITYVVDTSLSKLSGMFGEARAKEVWDSGRSAIDFIERTVNDEGIPCEFNRCPEFIYANDEKEAKAVEEDSALAKRFGFDVRRSENGLALRNAGYSVVEGQAKFHPVKYVVSLREKAIQNGALIFDDTEVTGLVGGRHVVAKTPDGTVSASSCFIATHEPFNGPKELFARKGTYVTYVMQLKIKGGVLQEGLYIDQSNPYHYIRVDSRGDHDRVILGGEDHRKEIPMAEDKAFASLEEYFRSALPGVGYEVIRKWNGPIIESVDGLPYIGTYSDERIFVATAFSGNGMTYGTTAGRMYADHALGNEVRWKSAFDPKRHASLSNLARKGKDYVEEFLHGAVKNILKRQKK